MTHTRAARKPAALIARNDGVAATRSDAVAKRDAVYSNRRRVRRADRERGESKMRKLMVGALCAVGLLDCAAHADTPALSTRWGRTKLSQDQCLANAERSIRAADFDRRPPTATSRYGIKGNYVVAIRCLTELGMYFMVSAGPSQNGTDKNVEAVDNGF
jgi:hypothetical protein